MPRVGKDNLARNGPTHPLSGFSLSTKKVTALSMSCHFGVVLSIWVRVVLSLWDRRLSVVCYLIMVALAGRSWFSFSEVLKCCPVTAVVYF